MSEPWKEDLQILTRRQVARLLCPVLARAVIGAMNNSDQSSGGGVLEFGVSEDLTSSSTPRPIGLHMRHEGMLDLAVEWGWITLVGSGSTTNGRRATKSFSRYAFTEEGVATIHGLTDGGRL